MTKPEAGSPLDEEYKRVIREALTHATHCIGGFERSKAIAAYFKTVLDPEMVENNYQHLLIGYNEEKEEDEFKAGHNLALHLLTVFALERAQNNLSGEGDGD